MIYRTTCASCMHHTVIYCLIFWRPMYYMFVDESGTTQISGAATPDDVVYMHCGLIVHASSVHKARAAVDRAKRELFRGKDPMKWELHGYEVWRSRGRFAEDLCIPDRAKRLEVFARTAKAIRESGAVLVGVIIRKDRLPSGQRDPLKLSWRLLVERFEQYLADHGGGERGNIIADASGHGTEGKILRQMRHMSIGIGRHRVRPVLVSKDVIFVDSLSEPLVQAADIAAYIMHKHCHGDALFGSLFDALVPSMWRRDGKLEGFGIKHYPDRG